MVENEKKGGKDRNTPDEFWDISDLVIRPKQKKELPVRRYDTSTAEISLPPLSQSADAAVNHRVVQQAADAPIPISKADLAPGNEENKTAEGKRATPPQEIPPEAITYTPAHPLIERVTLLPWKTNFPYYERFCRIARDLFYRTGERCEAEPFFSYMPQYDQMTRSQLAWYLYWRDEVRKGNYLKTGYCYIFLLLFEIINLPDLIPPSKGIAMMCKIWTQYREEHLTLDRYLCEWICDYCLLHRLPAPVEQLESIVRDPSFLCQLREFYVHAGQSSAAVDADVYMNCCSNYDYKKSRFYTQNAENAAACDRHIPGALCRVLQSLQTSDSLFSQTQMQSSTMTRDTFVGALCSHRVKYKIGVRYRSFSRSHELRFFITDVIKYSENKLRALHGYKSKLSIYALSEPIKAILNAYFVEAYPKNIGKSEMAEQRPDYEKLYDLPTTPMTAAEAARIEQESWRTTQRLVEAFEENDAPEITCEQSEVHPIVREEQPCAPLDCEQMPAAETPIETETSDVLSKEALSFLRYAYATDAAGQKAYCRSVGKMPENIADEINEYAADTLGDILLEDDGSGAFIVIEDYREQARALLERCTE